MLFIGRESVLFIGIGRESVLIIHRESVLFIGSAKSLQSLWPCLLW